MVNMKKYVTKKYLNVEVVKEEKITTIVLMDAGTESKGNYGDQITFQVMANKKDFLYTPNGDSVKNLIQAFGTDNSEEWRAKLIEVEIQTNKQNKEVIVCKGKVE